MCVSVIPCLDGGITYTVGGGWCGGEEVVWRSGVWRKMGNGNVKLNGLAIASGVGGFGRSLL